jgi:hypothetical protein
MTRSRPTRKKPRRSARAPTLPAVTPPSVDLSTIELTLWRMEYHFRTLIGHCERLLREKTVLQTQNRALHEEMDLLRDDIDTAHRYIGRLAQRKTDTASESATREATA